MTARYSTGIRNFLAKGGSIAQALKNGRIEIYSGAQPTSADAAVTGTLLTTVTGNSAAQVVETLATGTMTLAGSAGSVNTVTVAGADILGGAVPFNGTLNQTALDVASQINRNQTEPEYSASATGAVVTIIARPGTGASPNTLTVAGTLTTLTATYTALAGGVAGSGGLNFDNSVAGVLSKLATQTWSGVNANTGTAGWFRQYGGQADTGALDAAGVLNRIDGAISSSGSEMNLNNTALTAAATTSLPTWQMTVPAQ